MSKLILDQLFGSKIRVKILKYIYRNYPENFTIGEVAKHVQERYKEVRMEIKLLKEAGLIKKHR